MASSNCHTSHSHLPAARGSMRKNDNENDVILLVGRA